MTTIESKKVIVNALPAEVFDFLCDLNNYKILFPQDRISDWQSDNKQCSFRVQGTATIELIFKDGKAASEVNLVSGDASPFPFTLDVFLEDAEDGLTQAYLLFNGEMNAMIKMMVQRPLTNLFDYVADQLVEVNK